MKRRVVVTGMGVLSPAGNSIPEFLKSLREGRSAYGPIQSFDTSHFPVKDAYEVKPFTPHVHGTHLLDPFIQYAVAAADEALTNASFDPSQYDPFQIGIVVSSSKGGVRTLDRFSDRFYRNPSAILGARIYCNSVDAYRILRI